MRRSSKIWSAVFMSALFIVVTQFIGHNKKKQEQLRVEAVTQLESDITHSVKLRKLDATLTYIYEVVVEKIPEEGVESFSILQRQWLDKRTTTCNMYASLKYREACLCGLYQARVDAFYMFYEINRRLMLRRKYSIDL